MPAAFVHLASRSPRRRELLAQIGIEHAVVEVDVDETLRAGEAPAGFACRLAREKAQAGAEALGAARRGPVLGADTVVVVDGVALGKPRDDEAAMKMLQSLSGRSHVVMTAVALADAGVTCRLNTTEVWFRPLTEAECRSYCATREPHDKAGAYGIQGRAAVFIERIEGSYSGVMGLPLFETAALLGAAGVLPVATG